MNTFKNNELVMHVRDGLCSICGKTVINDNEYYVLLCNSNSDKNYVAVNNADQVIRKIMDVSTAEGYLKPLKNVVKDFNNNTKQRRDTYKKRLSSGLIEDYFYLYRQYHLLTKNNEGEHLGPIDIEMLKKAYNMVIEEMAITFAKAKEEIESHLLSIIEK